MRDERGMTILEAVVAVAIMLIGGMVLFDLILYSKRIAMMGQRHVSEAVIRNNLINLFSRNDLFVNTIKHSPTFSCFSGSAPYNACAGGGGSFKVCMSGTGPCNPYFDPVTDPNAAFNDAGNNCSAAVLSDTCSIQPVLTWKPLFLGNATASALIEVDVDFKVFNSSTRVTDFGASNYSIRMIRPAPTP